MFIHIGGDVIVFLRDIIAILDLERTTTMQPTRSFLKTAEEEGFLMTIGEELPKSFVLVETEYRYQVYLTSLSAATLYKRCSRMLQQPQKELSGQGIQAHGCASGRKQHDGAEQGRAIPES